MTLDELRNDHPELGFALYALEPDGPVTFEVMTPDSQVFTFNGATAQAAIDSAFPPVVLTPERIAQAKAIRDEIMGETLAELKPALPEPPQPDSIFD